MSTTEHLFMQIFNRKRSIEDQFKHQVDSYGENIALNLLSEGLRPPPWLWISRSLCSDPREANREQLISKILDQHPWATIPAKSNIYIVQDLKKTNVNPFSNITFPEQDVLNKFCGANNGYEFFSKDVRESSMQNSETRVEVEVMEKQFTHTSVSNNDTNSHHSKRAKTLSTLVEESNSLEFTGRVTRSMSTGQKSGYVKCNDSVSRSGSQGHKCQSLDQPSIMTESLEIADLAHDGSEVNEHILDDPTAYTTNDGCQLTNTLSSRLSAISLLPEQDIPLAETIEYDVNPVSKFDQKNNENAEILHNSRTIRRIEESHMDLTKEQVDGFIEIANPPSSIRVPCRSSGKTPASDRNVEECHANSKEASIHIQITNKLESESVVERKGACLNDNLVADSDIVCTVYNHNGDECAYTSETDVQTIGSNANISPPLTNHLHEIVYDSLLSIEKIASSEGRVMPDAKKNCNAVQTRYLLRSSTSHDKQHGSSMFSGITNSCNLKESMDNGHDNTWPRRNRNGNQFSGILDTFPRLRVKTQKHNKPVNCIGKKSSDNISGAIFDFQLATTSQNTEVELPEAVSGSQFRAEQISKKPRTSEGEQESMGKYHASDEGQEVDIGEGNVPNLDKCSLEKVVNNSPLKLGEYEEQHGSSTLSGITNFCNLKGSMDEGHNNTWPKRKRNMNQFINVLDTFPRLRVMTHKHSMPVNCIDKESSDNVSGAIFEFQPAMTSKNTEVELPEAVSGSRFRVEQINKKPRTLEFEQESIGQYHASDEDREVDIGEEYFSIITDCNVPNLDKCSLEKVVKNSPLKMGKYEESMISSKALGREGSSDNLDGSSMFSEHREDGVNLDENLPDFEGFTIGIAPIIADGIITSDSKISSLSKERASLIEQLCKSGSMLTMESCPLDDNIHNSSNVHQSLHADVLEQMNLSCHNNGSDKDQPSTSKNVMTTEKFPLTPAEKLQQRKITRKSFASGEEIVSNPELVCVRINENSSVSQEESTSDHAVSSNEVCRSPNITVLAQKYQNIMSTTDSMSQKYSEREPLDSVKPKSRLKADSKENTNLEGKLSHVANISNSLHRMPSAKATNRNIVRTSSEKQSKPNNIVSNISSFIPLVKEKQQTTTHALGKRDIKVKALEAAEAAKRLEEKKQQEREMKKAAAKLERVTLEQKNIRQLEVKQKQKEKLRKKKEADIEAKKRQREVEKAETERKRRRAEEIRRHQSAHDKNIQDKNEGVKKRKRKELSKGVKKLAKTENGMKAACMVSRETTSAVSKDERDELIHLVNNIVDSSCNLQNLIQNCVSVTAEIRDLSSYEISPYKDSDDEDGDGDYMRRKKFVPSWARKESLNQIILASSHLNPTAVFSRKRSFDLVKVFAPQVNRRPLP